MKLHVVKPQEQAIENYTKAIVSNNDVNLSEISDNECEVIMANDAVDQFDVENWQPSYHKSFAKRVALHSGEQTSDSCVSVF